MLPFSFTGLTLHTAWQKGDLAHMPHAGLLLLYLGYGKEAAEMVKNKQLQSSGFNAGAELMKLATSSLIRVAT